MAETPIRLLGCGTGYFVHIVQYWCWLPTSTFNSIEASCSLVAPRPCHDKDRIVHTAGIAYVLTERHHRSAGARQPALSARLGRPLLSAEQQTNNLTQLRQQQSRAPCWTRPSRTLCCVPAASSMQSRAVPHCRCFLTLSLTSAIFMTCIQAVWWRAL